MKKTLGGLKQQKLWEQQVAFFGEQTYSNQSINKHVECPWGQLGPNSCYCTLTLCMHVLLVPVQCTADR